MGKNVLRTIFDEGTSTCMMYISCWRDLSAPSLMTSSTILKAFDGHTFHPHGIISALPINLKDKNVSVIVEVVDATIDYNLHLGQPWF